MISPLHIATEGYLSKTKKPLSIASSGYLQYNEIIIPDFKPTIPYGSTSKKYKKVIKDNITFSKDDTIILNENKSDINNRVLTQNNQVLTILKIFIICQGNVLKY